MRYYQKRKSDQERAVMVERFERCQPQLFFDIKEVIEEKTAKLPELFSAFPFLIDLKNYGIHKAVDNSAPLNCGFVHLEEENVIIHSPFFMKQNKKEWQKRSPFLENLKKMVTMKKDGSYVILLKDVFKPSTAQLGGNFFGLEELFTYFRLFVLPSHPKNLVPFVEKEVGCLDVIRNAILTSAVQKIKLTKNEFRFFRKHGLSNRRLTKLNLSPKERELLEIQAFDSGYVFSEYNRTPVIYEKRKPAKLKSRCALKKLLIEKNNVKISNHHEGTSYLSAFFTLPSNIETDKDVCDKKMKETLRVLKQVKTLLKDEYQLFFEAGDAPRLIDFNLDYCFIPKVDSIVPLKQFGKLIYKAMMLRILFYICPELKEALQEKFETLSSKEAVGWLVGKKIDLGRDVDWRLFLDKSIYNENYVQSTKEFLSTLKNCAKLG